jgi:hypothetical protein
MLFIIMVSLTVGLAINQNLNTLMTMDSFTVGRNVSKNGLNLDGVSGPNQALRVAIPIS